MQNRLTCLEISGRKIGPGNSVYIVAELSANHNQKFDQAVELVKAAKEAGADAIKLQTYTPDTMTIDAKNEYFRVGEGTLWAGRTLHALYGEAYMPWEWQPKLKEIANELGLTLFSTAYDRTAVDFLERMNAPAYKVASFEIVDIPLIEYIASKGKPMIISTGMATLAEVNEAVEAARQAGASQIAVLKCTSAYPAPPEEMNLRTIPHLAEAFRVPAGLSDHTLSIAVPVAAVAMGACILEKHLTLSRKTVTADSAFSLEPQEFKEMVEAIRTAEKALGTVNYAVTEQEAKSRSFRRSLFVVKDIKRGEVFTAENVRSIRPGHGLLPKLLEHVLGRQATQDVKRGTPLRWEMIL
jgi:N-acetylneuraminate synthase